MESTIYPLMAELEKRHWWFIGRRNIISKVLDGFMPRLPGTKVLDVGCGTGGNLALFSQYGAVFGVEVDDDACRIAKQKQVGTIIKRDFLSDQLPFEEETFDLIALIDVLEHIEQHKEALCKVTSYLKKRGYLVLTVPAFSFLWSTHDEWHHHKRRYTRYEICNLLETAGMRVVYSSYFHFWFFPLIAVIRAIQAKTKIFANRKEVSMPNYYVNKILTAIFLTERFFIGKVKLPFGVSIIALAQKADQVYSHVHVIENNAK